MNTPPWFEKLCTEHAQAGGAIPSKQKAFQYSIGKVNGDVQPRRRRVEEVLHPFLGAAISHLFPWFRIRRRHTQLESRVQSHLGAVNLTMPSGMP